MRRFPLFALLLMGLFVAWGLAVSPAQAQPPVTGDVHLVIMHTNDVHAHYEPFNKYGGLCSVEQAEAGERFGGVARLRTMVRQIRDQHPHALLLDAGDEFQGTLFFIQYQGQAAQEFMNALGYNAMVVGNHEFDAGPAALAKFVRGANFPVLGANVDASADPDLQGLLQPYVVLQVGEEQVGVIGVTTELTAILSRAGSTVKFTDPFEAVQKYVDELEAQGVQIIVVLSHLGYGRDQELAQTVGGIDIIVGGHTHTFLSNDDEDAAGPYPTVVTSPRGEPVLIVTDKSYAKYLGYLEASFAAGVASAWKGGPVLLDASVPEDQQMAQRVAELAQPLNELRRKIIGEAAVDLDGERASCRFGECLMGNLVTDTMLWATQEQGVQIALMNGGGIRASIPAGPVSVGQVLEVLPFGNTIATFKLRGEDLWAVLENGVSKAENPENEGTGRFLQVAGLRYTWDPQQPVGQRILRVEVRNPDGSYTPLDPQAVYKVAANDYIRHGGDGFSVLAEKAIDPYDFGPLLADVVMEYIKTHSPVRVEIEGRIRQAQRATATPEATVTLTPAPTATLASPQPSPTLAPTSSGGAVPIWVWLLAVVVVVFGIAWLVSRRHAGA